MELIYKQELDTPLGKLQILATIHGLCFIEFKKPGRHELMNFRLARWFDEARIVSEPNKFTRQTEKWIKNFFNKKFEKLIAPPLDERGTAFEKMVWKTLRTVPLGKTKSYGEVAHKIKKNKAARAIGMASRRNPISLITPCHRIIGSTGKLVGYGGGLNNKNWLLEFEAETKQ